MADDQDNPGGRVPLPLTYLLTLLLGVLLNRRFHVPFLPHGVTRVLGWPLVGGGTALATWFIRTMRAADTTLEVNKPVSNLVQDGAVPLQSQPRLPLSGDDLRGDSHPSERFVGHPLVAVAAGCWRCSQAPP